MDYDALFASYQRLPPPFQRTFAAGLLTVVASLDLVAKGDVLIRTGTGRHAGEDDLGVGPSTQGASQKDSDPITSSSFALTRSEEVTEREGKHHGSSSSTIPTSSPCHAPVNPTSARITSFSELYTLISLPQEQTTASLPRTLLELALTGHFVRATGREDFRSLHDLDIDIDTESLEKHLRGFESGDWEKLKETAREVMESSKRDADVELEVKEEDRSGLLETHEIHFSASEYEESGSGSEEENGDGGMKKEIFTPFSDSDSSESPSIVMSATSIVLPTPSLSSEPFHPKRLFAPLLSPSLAMHPSPSSSTSSSSGAEDARPQQVVEASSSKLPHWIRVPVGFERLFSEEDEEERPAVKEKEPDVETLELDREDDPTRISQRERDGAKRRAGVRSADAVAGRNVRRRR